MQRDPQAGFSLIEALVALSILAVSATYLLSATERHARDTIALTDRIKAHWVAQDRLVALEAGLRELPRIVPLAGAEWLVVTDFSKTSDPDLDRVDISVSPGGTPRAVLASLTGFLAKPEAG